MSVQPGGFAHLGSVPAASAVTKGWCRHCCTSAWLSCHRRSLRPPGTGCPENMSYGESDTAAVSLPMLLGCMCGRACDRLAAVRDWTRVGTPRSSERDATGNCTASVHCREFVLWITRGVEWPWRKSWQTDHSDPGSGSLGAAVRIHNYCDINNLPHLYIVKLGSQTPLNLNFGLHKQRAPNKQSQTV